MRPSKPAFHSILDLGLRDVGVKNDPRRLAAHFGKRSFLFVALVVVFVVAACAGLRRLGADGWLVAAFALAWTATVVAALLLTMKRTPIAVVRVSAEGTNHATWLLEAPAVLVLLAAIVTRDLVLVPAVVLSLAMAIFAWRARGRIPELLRTLRPVIADEPVLGDGMGLVQGSRGGRAALRVIIATERRLLVAGSGGSVVIDVPYDQVSRFGIEWKQAGRIGVLSVTVAGEEHVITSIAPANLVSIALALQSHGVEPDDAVAVAEAQRGWEEALRRATSPDRRFSRAAMRTREFDRGLWLLLGLCAVVFYLNPFGVGIGTARDAMPALLAVPVLCAVCGYVSRTGSSLAYLAPLNLLVAPAFFFVDAGEVIALMVVLSAVATLGLWGGSALRANAATSPRQAARGSLRDALSGVGLIRISGALLGLMVALVASAGAAGLELTSLRLAVEEATAEQPPVDGRSNLTGGAASLTYTPGPGLREFVTDEPPLAGPDDGARWELRSSFTKGYNVLTLGHYIVEPRLDNRAAVAAFIADKDRAHSRLAGFPVTHTERVVDGRSGYVWDHGGRRGYWYFSAWFPQPVHSVRLECIARKDANRFKRLCSEAIGSLEFG